MRGIHQQYDRRLGKEENLNGKELAWVAVERDVSFYLRCCWKQNLLLSLQCKVVNIHLPEIQIRDFSTH